MESDHPTIIKKKLPLVTIGLPVYNGEKYLRRALDSLLAQDYENFELVISDNASTDQTRNICLNYTKSYERIRYYRSEKNIGIIANFLQVLDLAHGDYFMWAASDDIWMPEFIRKLVNQLENNNQSDVAMSATRRVRGDAILHDLVHFSGSKDPSKMSHFRLGMALASGLPYHLYVCGLFRTDFLRKASTNFPTVVAGDRLFVCQVALVTKFSYVDEVLYVRNVHSLPIANRYSTDPLGIEHGNIFSTEKTLFALGIYLFNSGMIPFSRKLLIPILVLRYAFIDRSLIYRLCLFIYLRVRGFLKRLAGE